MQCGAEVHPAMAVTHPHPMHLVQLDGAGHRHASTEVRESYLDELLRVQGTVVVSLATMTVHKVKLCAGVWGGAQTRKPSSSENTLSNPLVVSPLPVAPKGPFIPLK